MRSLYWEVPFCQTGRGDTWLSIQSQPSGPQRVGPGACSEQEKDAPVGAGSGGKIKEVESAQLDEVKTERWGTGRCFPLERQEHRGLQDREGAASSLVWAGQ